MVVMIVDEAVHPDGRCLRLVEMLGQEGLDRLLEMWRECLVGSRKTMYGHIPTLLYTDQTRPNGLLDTLINFT